MRKNLYLLAASLFSCFLFVSNSQATTMAPQEVNLTSFKTVVKNNIVKISWTTESERSNDFFIIMKSRNGSHFSVLKRVDGSGTTTVERYYQETESNVKPGTIFYKLIQVDEDGREEEIGLNQVKVEGKIPGLVIANTNPRLARLAPNLPWSQNVQVLNSIGQVVKVFDPRVSQDLGMWNMSDGIYYIKTEFGIEKVLVAKNQ